MANYKSGMKMQMGSKQKNTPTNFSEKDAMLMHEPGHVGTDPGSSLGNDVGTQYDELYDKYSSKAGNAPINQKIIMNSGESGGGYQALGGVVKSLIKPKKGEEGYARQQERKESRKLGRIERGFGKESQEYKDQQQVVESKSKVKGTQTKVGEKLRNIFKKKEDK